MSAVYFEMHRPIQNERIFRLTQVHFEVAYFKQRHPNLPDVFREFSKVTKQDHKVGKR